MGVYDVSSLSPSNVTKEKCAAMLVPSMVLHHHPKII